MRRSLVAALALAGAAVAMSLPSSAAPMSRLADGAAAAGPGGLVQQVWHGHHHRHCSRVCHGHLHWRYGYAHCHGHWEWRCHHHHYRHHHHRRHDHW